MKKQQGSTCLNLLGQLASHISKRIFRACPYQTRGSSRPRSGMKEKTRFRGSGGGLVQDII